MRKRLGADVEIDTIKLPEDHEANAVLERIGQDYAKKQQGMEYIGTICIHIYKERNHLAKTTYSLSDVTIIHMKEMISEDAVLTLWQNSAIRIRRYFNPSFAHKSTDNKDKRGQVK